MTATALDACDQVGIILVHGYLGQPDDLASLTAALTERHGANAVEAICLPGHGAGLTPCFDETGFLDVIAAAIDRQLASKRHLVLCGHSTGGSLLLAEIGRRLATHPGSLSGLRLLILCATPPCIDLGYAERWAVHTGGREIQLHDIGALVSLVNRLARRAPLAVPAPTLVLHGEADELVPVETATQWRARLPTAQRHIGIPGARHHLFQGDDAAIAVDTICRAIDDARQRHAAPTVTALFERVPSLESFCATWTDAARHLANGPAGRRAQGGDFHAGALAETEPTLANIEITTRCNLGCPACARTQRKLRSRHMSRADFQAVLTRLPHAFRVVLVGLGEPLMHPEVVDFIRIAVADGRRVGLVTNAMLLDADMAKALCASGLASITFSLDAADQATAARVRTGSDMALISANIRGFMEERDRQSVALGTSAFTALTGDTIDHFEAIVDFVADHGIDALMVSDLNFPSNQTRSVHQSFNPEHAKSLRQALRKAVARQLPVLSVLGLEEYALESRYLDYLLLRGDQVAARSTTQRHCYSPWQTVPVNVDGHLTLCDCQPEAIIGNIHRDPLDAWWNGPAMTDHRRRMLSDNPPEACLVCPRF